MAAAALLPLLALLAYHNSFSVPLLLDDKAAIAENPSLRSLADLGAVLMPPPEIPTAGRPLLNLSFAVNFAQGGRRVAGYHVVNLALHAGAALALFGLVRRTLLARGEADRFARVATPLAFAIAALWAVHPVQTASVTYLAQRAEVLLGLFYLLTLYCFARAASARDPVWAGLAVAACALGMLSKETMVTAPLLVLLYDRTFFAGTFREALRRRGRCHAMLAATWLLLAALMITSRVAERGVGYTADTDAWRYALTQCRAVLEYARLAVWPYPLIFDRGPEVMATGLADVGLAVGGMALLIAATVAGLWRARPAGFLAAAFLIVLAPTSSVVPVIHQPMAENRVYLPLAAAVSGLVLAGYGALRHRLAPALAVLVPGLVLLTVRRNSDYGRSVTIWADTVRKQPGNARAHSHLGEAVLATGDLPAARRHFQAALRLNPDYGPAHNNLGIMLLNDLGRAAEAVAHLEAARRALPDSPNVHNNLALALAQLPERQEEAIPHFRAAIRRAPDYAAARQNLAHLLLRLPGRASEALREYAEAVRRAPSDADAHANLALALAMTGRSADAVGHFETALRLRPDHATAHANFANTLSRMPGRAVEAIGHYRRALALEPQLAEAWANLGQLLLQMPRQRDAGIAALREAVRLQPGLTSARHALDRAQEEQTRGAIHAP